VIVIIAVPQVEAEQADVVAVGGGAAGAAGVVAAGAEGGAAVDNDIDEPPPQALKVAISKEQTAAGIHRRRVMNPFDGRLGRCIEVLPVSESL
jgi:hypothetical protein